MQGTKRLLNFLSHVILCGLMSVLIGCGGGNNTEQTMAGWKQTFGGPAVNGGNSIQQTTDGGYILVGSTNSFGAGQFDVYLIKTDAQGNALWSKTFGGLADDYGSSVQQTTDGGYILVGSTNSFGAGQFDVYLIKTDAQGNTLWSRTFRGAEDDIASSVRQTTDGGYVIVGTTGEIYSSRVHSNVYLIKTDPNGNAVWTKTFGESSINSGNSVQQTGDGGYILTGTTFDFSSLRNAAYTVKTDQDGNIKWTTTYEDTSNPIVGISVQQTSDSGYVVLGQINSDLGNGEVIVFPILVKMDADGNILWTKTLEVAGMSVGSFYRTSDDGFIIIGTTGNPSSHSIYLVRTDSGGNILWSKTLAGTLQTGAAVQQTSDDGYVVVGATTSYSGGLAGVLVIKTDGNGNL